MKIGYIYKVTCLINNKIYIGSTLMKNPNYRWSKHNSEAKSGSSCKFHRAIRKYGKYKFNFEILFCTKNIENLEKIEQDFIDLYDCLNNKKGYNSIPTGNNRLYISERMKQEWSNSETRPKRLAAKEVSNNKRKISIVSVDLNSGIVKEYNSVNDAIRETKVSAFGVINSLKKRQVKGQGYIWFYKQDNFDYKEEAKKLLGKDFNTLFTLPIKASNLETNIEIKCLDIYEASKHTGLKTKEISKILRGKGKTRKNWSFNIIK